MVAVRNAVIPPMVGATPSELVLWDDVGEGWLVSAVVVADSPKLVISLDLQADRTLELTVSLEELYRYGSSNSSVFRVLRYGKAPTVDGTPIDNQMLYAAEYNPSWGFIGVPFRGRNRFSLLNPTTSPITVVRFQAALIFLK